MIGIKDIGTRQLEKRDLGDSLQFVLKRNPRWGNVVAELIVIGGVSFVAWWRHSVMLLVFAVVGIIGLVSNRLRGSETTLLVNRAEVVAQGDLQSSPAEEMTIPLNEITSMGGAPAARTTAAAFTSRRDSSGRISYPAPPMRRLARFSRRSQENSRDFPLTTKPGLR